MTIDTENPKCVHCGSDNLVLTEKVHDGDKRVEIYECRDCGKSSTREF